MTKLKRRQVGVSLLASAALVAGQCVVASAVPVSNDPELEGAIEAPRTVTAREEAQIRSFFNEYGVALDDQDTLIAAYENGGTWLSMTQGADPVSVRSESKDGMRSTISTFEDGSVTVASASLPQGPATQSAKEAAPRSVTGCSTSGNTRVVTHSNCLAKVDNGPVMMSFRFTWRLYVGSSASITKYFPNSREHRCIGCVMSDHRVYRISATNVRYAATIGLPPGEYLGWMGVRVSTSGASTYQGP